MKPLEYMLSPMIKHSTAFHQSNTLDLENENLIEKIKSQKIDVIKDRISQSQVDSVRPEIVESWLRSYSYGLDLYNNTSPVLDNDVFQEILREKESLMQIAEAYIRRLDTMLYNTNCIIILSDEQGVILQVLVGKGDTAYERNHMIPGTVINEKTVGTCSHGLCLLLGEPIQLCGPEHYSESFAQVIASSAPIFDINGNSAGTLSIASLHSQDQNPHTLGMAASMAWAIQNEFQFSSKNELFNATIEATNEAMITINKTGLITMANAEAKKVFNHLNTELQGRQIEEIMGVQVVIQAALEIGKPAYEVEIEIERLNQKLHLFVQPINNHFNKIIGCVLILKKNEQVTKLVNKIENTDTRYTFSNIIGNSPQMMQSINKAKKFAPLDINILIEGESGTGKELFAQAIHNESRPKGPFMAVNCAAIPKTLIESELFGYEGGAFTGAERQGRPGKIELTHNGTLFLDEIGDMPLDLQPVLLRVLEERKVMRVGGSRHIAVDFRLLAATNKDLLDLVKNNLFREDLYYRLAVFTTFIPPLRERGPDVIRLANHFIRIVAQRQHIPEPYLSDAAKVRLVQYNWPGNVRQLESTIIYAVNMSSHGVIQLADLPKKIIEFTTESGIYEDNNKLEQPKGVKDKGKNLSIKEIEKMTILQVLLQTENRVNEAANILGLSRTTLYRKMKEYNLLNSNKK